MNRTALAPTVSRVGSRALRVLVISEQALAFILLTGLTVLVVVQVFSRYVLNSPIPWTEELARFFFIWFTFVAAAYVMSQRKHIAVIVLSNVLNPKVTAAIEVAVNISVAVVAVIMAIGAYDLVESSMRLNAPASNIPMGVVYLSALVGYIFVAFHSLLWAWVVARHPERLVPDAEIIENGG